MAGVRTEGRRAEAWWLRSPHLELRKLWVEAGRPADLGTFVYRPDVMALMEEIRGPGFYAGAYPEPDLVLGQE